MEPKYLSSKYTSMNSYNNQDEEGQETIKVEHHSFTAEFNNAMVFIITMVTTTSEEHDLITFQNNSRGCGFLPRGFMPNKP